MAEYIDRQGLIKFLDNIQQPKIPITKGFKYIAIDDAIRVVSERPTANVIPIPEGATNGDMIKAMFPSARVSQIFPIGDCDEVYYVVVEKIDGVTNEMRVMKNWWNAPYRKVVR